MSTSHIIKAYVQDTPAPLFLSGQFQSPRENFHNSLTINVDVERETEDVSVPLPNVSVGYRQNQSGSFTNKEAKIPVYKEAESVEAGELMERQPGQSKNDDVVFAQNATSKSVKIARKLEKKIRRGLELQASQILQTGDLSLLDADGNVAYAADFKKKTSHFPNAVSDWDTPATASVVPDLGALADVIRDDGLDDPKRVYMGAKAFDNAMANPEFAARFEGRRANLGEINPMQTGGTRGGNYRGTVEIGNYKIDIWTYGGRYKDPTTGLKTQYIDPNKVIMMCDSRLDATFGGIPLFRGANQGNAMQFMPRRLGRPGAGMDMYFNAWMDNSGEILTIGVGARPLLIPTAIDTFGCLTTVTP